jgi:hypothetical protein
MSAVSAPFGLRPSFHPTGTIRPRAATITTGYAANIFQGSPVGFIADGSIALAPAAGTGITGAQGAFQGVEYTGTDGRRRVGNMWPASTAATDIVAYITADQYIVYDIQCNTTAAQDIIGGEYDWTANATANGNTTTGFSTVALDIASLASQKGMQVLGLTPAPDNAWGDAFPIVQVRLSEHQFLAPINGF